MWFDGPHQKAIAAREAAKHRKAKRKAKGLRKPAPSSCGRPQSNTPTATSSTEQSPHSRIGSPRHVVAGRTSG